MKVICEHFNGSERTIETWHYVDMISYDPLQIELRFEAQSVFLQTALVISLNIEDDPETLIF